MENNINIIGQKYKQYRKYISQNDVENSTLEQYWLDINTICKKLQTTIFEMYGNKETFEKYMKKLSEMYKVEGTLSSYSSNSKNFYNFWYAYNNVNYGIVEKIKQCCLSDKYKEIRECEEYYCQKAIDKYNEFLNYKVSEDKINDLIDLIDNVPNKNNRLKDITWTEYYLNLISDVNLKTFIEILFTLVSDIDMHASERNEYNGQRFVVGKTTKCFQNIWVKSLLNIYKNKNKMSGGIPRSDIKKCCNYLEDRINNFPIMNKKHLEKLSIYLLTLIDLDINCKNIENKTFLIKEVLYRESGIKQLWMNGDENMAEKTQSPQPLNQILYGPPGTGKTYSLKEYVRKILKDSQIKSLNEQYNVKSNNGEEFNILDYPWYIAIAYTLYENPTGLSVPELIDKMKEYIDNKRHSRPSNKLWQVLQAHALENSLTVHVANKQSPYIFDKDENSKWYLINKSFIEDFIYSEKLKKEIASNEIDDNTVFSDEINNKYVEFVTFHQSYSYEEFVEGIKPDIDKSDLKYEYNKGIFKELCIRANSDPDNNYVLIIDEINRGNISKIFGELITLIEKDKRIKPNRENDPEDDEMELNSDSMCYKTSLKVKLPYTKQKFGVPNNLYIIGTMNTADRSIASVDIALRRRFKFIEMMPKPELLIDKNDNYEITVRNSKNDKTELYKINLQVLLKTLNGRISYLLDPDHQIGHSYFLNLLKDENGNKKDYILESELKDVFKYEILPLLNEYFYGDWDKLRDVLIRADYKELGLSDKDNRDIYKYSLIKKSKKQTLFCSSVEETYEFNHSLFDNTEDDKDIFKIAIALIGKDIIENGDNELKNQFKSALASETNVSEEAASNI